MPKVASHLEAILGNPKDSTPNTPERKSGRGWEAVDEPAQSFTRTPPPVRSRTGQTPSVSARRSATPTPVRRHTARLAPPRPTLSELGTGLVHELGKNWRTGVVVGMVVMVWLMLMAGHAIWCYSSLPIDHYARTERMAHRLMPGSRWVSSRYGLISTLRCPTNWEAASFRLVGRARGDEAPPEAIMCCTATAEPSCQLQPEE